ncbi:MAG: hypothetical protein HC892_11560 [Saprospiraceae bacterium]|nr:hypothetical protein [Saprospiraceae bacterium]
MIGFKDLQNSFETIEKENNVATDEIQAVKELLTMKKKPCQEQGFFNNKYLNLKKN